MINPIYKQNILFVKDDCDYCKIAKKSVNEVNLDLPINNWIKIVYCDMWINYGAYDDLLIKHYEKYLNGFPTIFIYNENLNKNRIIKKEGANSVIEYTSWLKAKLFNIFLINKGNTYLNNIGVYEMFDYDCKKMKGRVICN